MSRASEYVITAPVELQLVASGGVLMPVDASFEYDPRDPYAVRARFRVAGDEPVAWVFARDLALQGLESPAGQGDIGVWPSRSMGEPVVCFALSSPDGQALLECRRDDLSGFLERTLELVPAGREVDHLDLETTLHRLLHDR